MTKEKINHMMVNHQTYLKYINENKTNKLDKFFKIQTYSCFIPAFESFNKLYLDTPYIIKEYVFDKLYSNYNGVGYQIFFKTNSNTEYRVDLIPVCNYLQNISLKFVWSVSFATSDKEVGDSSYEEMTNLNETREVLLRIGDIIKRLDIPKYFVIGNTLEEKRMNIYSGFLLLVFPDYNIKMARCDGFIDNMGLYIWI